VNQSDRTKLLQSALLAADKAREVLLQHYGNLHHITEKHKAGLVSEADKESERTIVECLSKIYPDHKFLGEEGADHKQTDSSSGLWIIDPLDGTTNYVHQFPVWAISIAFHYRGETLVGVVDAPKLDSRYHAVRDGGAFLNQNPIRVSTRTQFRDGLFATGFSSADTDFNHQLELVRCAVQEARGIRRAGAAALDLCFVAAGIFDVFWEKKLSPWDTAAGALIAREAGARVTNLRGEEYDPMMDTVVAGTPLIYEQFMEKVRSCGLDQA
jgi:myo-inositol-1(or 4)-monophosphatase